MNPSRQRSLIQQSISHTRNNSLRGQQSRDNFETILKQLGCEKQQLSQLSQGCLSINNLREQQNLDMVGTENVEQNINN